LLLRRVCSQFCNANTAEYSTLLHMFSRVKLQKIGQEAYWMIKVKLPISYNRLQELNGQTTRCKRWNWMCLLVSYIGWHAKFFIVSLKRQKLRWAVRGGGGRRYCLMLSGVNNYSQKCFLQMLHAFLLWVMRQNAGSSWKGYSYRNRCPSPTICSSTQGSESLLTARGGGLAIFMYCKRYSDKAGPGGAPAVVGGPSDLLRREGRVWDPPRSSDCNMNRKAIPSLRQGSGSPAKDISVHRPSVP
jgi:hypothetical protein